jgi:predicted TIM-barrel fold metal-dependent hydrolase
MTGTATSPTTGLLVNSADSHVVEPLDLWVKRLPEHLRDRAPRIEVIDGEARLMVEGAPPRRMGGSGTTEAERRDRERGDDGHFRAGGWDPDQRVRDLDEDGVWGEVLYPTIALFAYMIPDPELRWESCRAYNDWLAETFGSVSNRFAGAAMVSPNEVDLAVAEIERVAKLGLKSVMLPMNPPPDRPYNLDLYDPLWAAAQDHAMPVSFHVGTGSNPVTERGPGGAVINYVEVGLGAQRTLSYLASSGVLERFPRLHVVMVECGAGWLAWLCERMDEAFEEHGHWVKPKLAEPPSHYVRRQAHVTFGNDAAGVVNRGFTGIEPLLWSSDYPHPEGTWPHTQETLARIFTGVAPDERRAMTYETTARLYGLEAPGQPIGG